MANIMMSTLISTFFALIFIFTNYGLVKGFEMTFPVGPSESSYWVSCKENVLQWTYNSTDPLIFSVALYNLNSTKLNGNYQIANSVQSINGTVNVRPNCVEPGSGYYVGFVNASQYALNQPQIFYTSPTFSIQPNPTQIPPTPSSQPSQQEDTSQSGNTQSTTTPPMFGPANASQQSTANTTAVASGNSKNDGMLTTSALQWTVYVSTTLTVASLATWL